MIRFITYSIFFFYSLWSAALFADVTHYFNAIQHNPNALYAFFKEMPKGGELHYHLAGGAFPENMIHIAASKPFCVNPNTWQIQKKIAPCEGIEANTLFKKPLAYRQLIRAWSLKDFVPGKESAHDHFFASFDKFMPIVAEHSSTLLTEIIQRAANQQALYLEVMILPDQGNSMRFAPLIQQSASLSEKKQILLNNAAFRDHINTAVSTSNHLLQSTKNQLGCTKQPKQAACQVVVKFQYFILREQPLDNVFAQALSAFASASQSPEVVGINLVQAEDGILALKDYHEQMKIIAFLHQAYPNVHIALHAGELSPTDVTPENLRFHIQEAINIGHAERIGHGVDIAYENHAEALVKQMASNPIPVEINLTSNRKILGIDGASHPLHFYLSHHVPVVLSTDDEGVLRTDLTSQYVEAVITHHLNYPTIKNINRNALTYSFLPGASLWADNRTHSLTSACKELDSAACQAFLKTSHKAQLQWQLEKRLDIFEKRYQTRNEKDKTI